MVKKRGRSGRGRHELKSEINIVPLLDVLLVLLLIFMATAPIITQSINVDVELPSATDSKMFSNGDSPPVVFEVVGIGQYTLVVNHDRMQQLPSEQVIAEVQRRITDNPKTMFLIGGAKEVPYDEIVKAINILHQAGVKSVGLMTKPI